MKNKKSFHLTLFIGLFLLIPLNVLPANLSLLEINRAFHLLKNEIVDVHLSLSSYPQGYSPEEEAVLVLTKKATFGELINLNLVELPKDFIINAVLKGGMRLAGMSANPLELLEKELLNYSIEQIMDWLLQEEISMSGGEISISYQDINKKKKTENLLYSVTKTKDKEISITIYSGNYINPPLSVPGPVISNSLWRMNDFKKDLLSPFSITFSGEIEKTKNGAFFWKNNPKIEITFYEEPFSLSFSSPTFLNKIKDFANNLLNNTFSFFVSAENILKSSISAMIGRKDTKETSFSTLVDLKDSESQKDVKKETTKQEEDKKEEPPVTAKEKSITPTKVEINSALGEDLERLVGIGPTYAERIIEYRPYCTLDELTKVPGIGEVTLNKIKDQGIAYVNPPSNCSRRDASKEVENKEELIKMLFEAKEILEKIEESRKKEKSEEDDDNGEEEKDEDEVEENIEINSASLEDLTFITGIGPSLAERIIEHRPYCTLDELTKVPGIGEVTLTKIKDQGIAYVNPPESCFEKNNKGGSGSPSLPDDNQEENDNNNEEEEVEENIEINSASLEDLQKITGIGPTYAERIIENRPYCTIDDLIIVQGIGETTLNNIKDQGIAYVDPPESCFEEDNEDEEEEEDEEEGDNDEDEDDPPNFDIIIANAETYQNILLLQEIIDSRNTNKEYLEKSITSKAELLLEKILEKYSTIGLTKPEFIN
jgi:competence ComEA-like helix-hairpin-helix protein